MTVVVLLLTFAEFELVEHYFILVVELVASCNGELSFVVLTSKQLVDDF